MISRQPPSRGQVLAAGFVAIGTALALQWLRGYPWSLASLLGTCFGALTYTGWAAARRLSRLYRRRIEILSDRERQE